MGKIASHGVHNPPRAHNGLDVNVCLNSRCDDYFGVPVDSKINNNENNVFGHFKIGRYGDVVYLTCTKCKSWQSVVSNKAVDFIFQEYISGLVSEIGPPGPCCRNPECDNHKNKVPAPGPGYISYGRAPITKKGGGSKRYKCKACNRISIATPKAFRQRKTDDLPAIIFKAIVGSTPINKTIYMAGTGAGTYYSTLKFIHQQCALFAAFHERNIGQEKLFDHLYLSTDCQEYSANWRAERTSTAKEKNYPILHSIGTVDNDSGYIFGLHLNYRSKPSLKDLDTHFDNAREQGIPQHERAFPQYVNSFDFLFNNRKGAGQLLPSSYGVKLNETVHYTAHFLYLQRLLGSSYDHLTVYADGDDGFFRAFARAFCKEIREGMADYFILDYGKGKEKKYADNSKPLMTQRQLMRALASIRKDAEKKNIILDDRAVHAQFVIDQYESPPAKGKPWVMHPSPYWNEKNLRIWHKTPRNKTPLSLVAELILNASEKGVNRIFESIRTGPRGCARPTKSASTGSVSYNQYGMFNPEYMAMQLEIFRVWHNFVDPLKPLRERGKKKHLDEGGKSTRRAPIPLTKRDSRAVRIKLCSRLVSIEEILNFDPSDWRE